MPHAIGYRPFTAVAHVHSQNSPFWICGWIKWQWDRVFTEYCGFPQYYPTSARYSYFIETPLTLHSLSSWQSAVLTVCHLCTSFRWGIYSLCAVCFIFVSVAFTMFIRLPKIWLCYFLLMCLGFQGDQ